MKFLRRRIAAPVFILVGILIVALGLRVWGIAFGLPYLYHFDEHFYVNTALHLGQGVLHNPPYNPTGLSNLLFPQYAAYYLLGKLTGAFPSPAQFAAAYQHDPSIFFLLGRLTTAVLGTMTAFALFLLGKAATNQKVGLLAAGLIAVSFLHVRDSHYAVPDIAMSFFVVLAVGLAAIGLRYKMQRYIYLAGISAGLAIAMKWTAFPIVLTVYWAAVCTEQNEHKRFLARLINLTIVKAGIAVAVGFFLGSAQLFLNPTPYLHHLLGIQQVAQPDQNETVSIVMIQRWSFYWRTLQYGVGSILAILGIVGTLRRLFILLRNRDPMDLLLIAFPLTYVPVIGISGFFFSRYLLPLIPFFALFAAEFVYDLHTRAAETLGRRIAWSLATLMLAAAALQPLSSSMWHDILLTRTDTRTLAKEWIEDNIPEGSKIAIDWPVHGPPLSTLENVVPYSEKEFDAQYIGGSGLFAHPVEWYKDEGFDYLISNSYIAHNKSYGWMIPANRAFHTTLSDHFPLVKEFSHYKGDTEPVVLFLDEIYGPTTHLWNRIRPGPTIKIYQVKAQDI